MNLEEIREERQKWMTWKNIAPLREVLNTLAPIETKCTFGDTIKIQGLEELPSTQEVIIKEVAKLMMPWRKGPFDIFGLFIDTEWQSFLKYNLLEPYFNLKNKRVADIGCNNGYYMFRMLEHSPKKIVGFDPSALCKCQFDFINHYVKSDIKFELLGVEHLPFYEEKFDTVFCLGVLYHRPDPIGTLKALAKGMECGAELFLDTFMIDGDEDLCLSPEKTYSKIPNIYFVPTVKALKNWCGRAGFIDIEVLEITVTTEDEQRSTPWIQGQSLGSFLDPNDPSKTVEGYPAPKRVYIKAIRK
ncbi:tRNA 5-methoxyuridine(34)/uridine 5-oxyacetic acid(34) synthase CmoB [Sulfurimonas sp. MAG313]|nr:tRNA 5-methoxyuridine(34)/uridine 5-oxyacetic acid(34) synthase CmoB [Sulfurimonas sp. MAG313]MDF1879798.1 tRNA 5-methoxyuridine(34)/uridine 5-oxyacetic acid(34) synthase CmoB [Sulfurimonas sp. MAG313]